MEEHFEDPEQPRKHRGPDPLAGEERGEEHPDYESEREAEERIVEEDES